ncbi:MAG: hypothetical protein J6R88_01800 [Clostridia bacterium]|nr:hypothetical protein [Clostridia bacterium]
MKKQKTAKNSTTKYLSDLKTKYSALELEKLSAFFNEFNFHCLLSKNEKRKMKDDLLKAFEYYRNSGVSLDTALNRLSNENLGGFYAKPSSLWFTLDDAAKVYPFSLGHGSMSLFRLSAYMKKAIVPELLQIALTFTIKRFPTFATTIKKGVFWHYLDSIKCRFAVEKESTAPVRPIPVSKSLSPSFRVLYYQNRISVEFFHVLTDGAGGIEFLKCLISEYLKLLGVNVEYDDTLLNANDLPKKSEISSAFSMVEKTRANTGLVNKPALQLSGKLTKFPCRILHFKMSATTLKDVAHKHGVKITTYLLAVMFMASKYAIEGFDGNINIQVPVNMRKFYPSNTLRNFSMYCGVKIPLNKDYTFSELIKEVDTQLKEKSSKEEMSGMLAGASKLVSSIRLIPLIIKHPVAKLTFGVLGDKAFTNTLSNMGVVKMPENCANEIESFDFVLGTSVENRASCSLITFNDVSTFSITKKTVDPSYEEALLKILENDGISVTVEGSDIYDS